MSDTWKNRIVDYGNEPAGSFRANPLNWRIHPVLQKEALTGVLNEVGIDEGQGPSGGALSREMVDLRNPDSVQVVGIFPGTPTPHQEIVPVVHPSQHPW